MKSFTIIHSDNYQDLARFIAHNERVVICLCADWCGSCKDYLAPFSRLAEERNEHFVWLDIEDHADLVDDIDISNFPTLLLLQGKTPVFLGEMRPDTTILKRMLESLGDNPKPMSNTPATLELFDRLSER